MQRRSRPDAAPQANSDDDRSGRPAEAHLDPTPQKKKVCARCADRVAFGVAPGLCLCAP
jgi:hypothetical protein